MTSSQHDLIFSELSEQELQFVGRYLRDKKFETDEIILHQGSRGGDLYIIRSGSVAVNVALPGKQAKTISTLRKGHIFGEIAFLADALITATIIAKEPVHCAVLEADVLHMIRIVQPETAYKIEHAVLMQTLSKILHLIEYSAKKFPLTYQQQSGLALTLLNPAANRISLSFDQLNHHLLNQMDFFKNLDQDEKNTLFKYMTYNRYEKGFHFDTSDLNERSINIIYSGAVMIFNKNKHELKKSLAVHGVSELFFRNFLSRNFSDTLTYVACENCILLELNDANHQRLKKEHPEIFYKITQIVFSVFIKLLYIVNRQVERINSEISV